MTEQSPPPPDPDHGSIPYATPSASGGEYTGPPPDKDSITMGMLCHLLGIFTGFVGPLVIWLIKKDSSPFVDDQGKEALNFQIAALIATFCCFPLFFIVCLTPLLIAAVQIIRIVFSIIATVEANKGNAYRYPLTIRLIK